MCLYCIYAQYVGVGKPRGLCRQVGSDRLIPMLTDPPTDAVDIKTSKADLQSGPATSGQSLELRTERRSDVFIRGGSRY